MRPERAPEPAAPRGHDGLGPAAAVVICAARAERWDDLRRAVASVLFQTRQPHDLAIVIDHNEALLERARRAFPHLTVVPNEGERGRASSRRTGMAVTTAPVVVFLDDDVVAERTWLAK